MELAKEKWGKTEAEEMEKYLRTLARPEKVEWTTKIIGTSLPVLAISTPDLRMIAKKIMKGNWRAYLELGLFETYEDTAVSGLIISEIDNFCEMKKYLYDFASKIDNWASCDLVSFEKVRKEQNEIFETAKMYILDSHTFVRRMGVDLLIFLARGNTFTKQIFEILANCEEEKEYYVNMCLAWLFAELFTHHREESYAFLAKGKMSKFVTNKAISKCRDSFRVSAEDKDALLKYRK